nr:MmgE/PrpD family protein [uncultured Rhodopila sp.]
MNVTLKPAALSRIIADYAVDTRAADIPARSLAAAAAIFADTLGVAWGGTDAPGVGPLRGRALATGGRGEAQLWGGPVFVPAQTAALVNGVAAAALDYDTVHEAAGVHADAVVSPAVFAVAQQQHASGRDFLAALTLGNDITCRLALATTAHSGWFYSSIHGVFGTAAACARLLGLDAGQTAHALGIALSLVGGTQQPMVERSLTKRLQSAFAAQAGVQAAQLAADGITGPEAAFEGRYGFYAMYEDGDPAIALQGLGQRFEHGEVIFKKFPTCACGHAASQAALELIARTPVRPEQIAGIVITITPYMNRLVGSPFSPDPNPQVAAQFSVQYHVASILLRGRLGLAELDAASVRDPAIAALVARSRVELSGGPDDRLSPAAVALHLTDGSILRQACRRLPGTRETPLSADENAAKFADVTSRGVFPLSGEQGRLLRARVDGVAALADMAAFFDGIV